jgi:hypothetical protein
VLDHDAVAIGEVLSMLSDGGMARDFNITGISTDVEVCQYRYVHDEVIGDPYYIDRIIVDIAGYPHPDRDMAPWYGKTHGVPLPNQVENG